MWRSLWQRRLPLGVNLLLILLLAHDLAALTWRLLAVQTTAEGPSIAFPAPLPTAMGGGKGESRASTLRDIAGWHLFGQLPEKAPVPVTATPVVVPESRLNLTLLGISFSDSRGANRHAIILAPPQEEQLYKVGDLLPGDVRIREIRQNQVILERKGRLELLNLPKESSEGITTAPARESLPPPDGKNRQAGALLKNVREQLQTSPEKVLEKVRIEPAQVDGRFAGFQFFNGEKAPGFLEQFGLQSSDIVVEVNGTHLDSPFKGMEVLGQLATANRLNLQVRRGTTVHSFILPIDP